MAALQTDFCFVLFPRMAHGHLLPMVDMARILVQSGAMVTIITTSSSQPDQTSDLSFHQTTSKGFASVAFPITKKIGVRIHVEIAVMYGEEENVGVLLKKEDVKAVIECLMKEDEDG
ncbi:hypothetical protein QVD17_11662 [Tagetes erecta]|uniref:Uncharacterized protein n=1 Tax=Tagetes erecta TaxID=13708 RepID=A0AAD8P138_TARER|nr:hypothetical protein QVD17_11662 [Tagetes erecta]